jgi:hypothetical protein
VRGHEATPTGHPTRRRPPNKLAHRSSRPFHNTPPALTARTKWPVLAIVDSRFVPVPVFVTNHTRAGFDGGDYQEATVGVVGELPRVKAGAVYRRRRCFVQLELPRSAR